ncbi:MAG: flavodoxin-dependent (E)-4-hydroxy-3-methylbut-2-enyl-diphosphate synthase, partial [Clostridiales bacterium]|nr:flavodoxin-dependent (E)-4-hydroxy-3-methylbut-2-enyl-diphosphate synthase [Clostridiales bacterium]
MRMKTREIAIGDVTIGGNHPIAIQSMTNTKTQDVEA